MAHRIQAQTAPQGAPTQVRLPWRATVRTVAVALVALLPLFPEIAQSAEIDTVPAIASVLAVAAAVQRVISLPAVDRILGRYLGAGARSIQEYMR